MKRNYQQRQKVDINDLIYSKQPPQDIECERKLLGVIMQSNDALSEVVPILPAEEHFYLEAHRMIYGAILNLYQKGGSVDVITIVSELIKRSQLQIVGGAYALSQITDEVNTSARFIDWAMIVKEKSTLRAIIANCGVLLTEAYEDSTDVFELLDKAQGLMQQVSDSNYAGSMKPMSKTAGQYLERMEQNRQSKHDFTGVPTGYYSFDRITGGFQKGDLIILSAEASTGKTCFLLNVAWNAATHAQKPTPTLIFSLEMGTNPIMGRLVSNVGGINMNLLNQPKLLSEFESNKVTEIVNIIASKPILIDDKSSINTMEIKAKIRKFIKANGPDVLVIVDYIQLTQVLNGDGMSKEEMIGKVSKNLKVIAKELDIPIVAISSLSRNGQLKGSSDLDFDADLIIHIRKPGVEELKLAHIHADDRLFDITKHRNGETNCIVLRFIKEYQRFTDMGSLKTEFKTVTTPTGTGGFHNPLPFTND